MSTNLFHSLRDSIEELVSRRLLDVESRRSLILKLSEEVLDLCGKKCRCVVQLFLIDEFDQSMEICSRSLFNSLEDSFLSVEVKRRNVVVVILLFFLAEH